MRYLMSVGVVFVVAALGGCRHADRTASLTLSSDADHVSAFRAGEYRKAEQLAGSSRNDEAVLIRGMALSQLGEHLEAERALRRLTTSRDPGIRGRALATLGLSQLERGNHAKAAPLLADASRALTGTDRVWAAKYAAESYRASGNAAAAASLERVAGPALTAQSTAGGTYAIQFGSFSTETRALRHQQSMRLLTQRSGLPTPSVSPVERGGRTLYAVRSVGFDSADDARSAADGLRTETTVVAVR